MVNIENQLLILTCDVSKYLYKQSFKEQKKDEARKRRCRKGKI